MQESDGFGPALPNEAEVVYPRLIPPLSEAARPEIDDTFLLTASPTHAERTKVHHPSQRFSHRIPLLPPDIKKRTQALCDLQLPHPRSKATSPRIELRNERETSKQRLRLARGGASARVALSVGPRYPPLPLSPRLTRIRDMLPPPSRLAPREDLTASQRHMEILEQRRRFMERAMWERRQELRAVLTHASERRERAAVAFFDDMGEVGFEAAARRARRLSLKSRLRAVNAPDVDWWEEFIEFAFRRPMRRDEEELVADLSRNVHLSGAEYYNRWLKASPRCRELLEFVRQREGPSDAVIWFFEHVEGGRRSPREDSLVTDL